MRPWLLEITSRKLQQTLLNSIRLIYEVTRHQRTTSYLRPMSKTLNYVWGISKEIIQNNILKSSYMRWKGVKFCTVVRHSLQCAFLHFGSNIPKGPPNARPSKVKVWTLVIALLRPTWVRLMTSSALQSRKWQLIGMSQWWRSALCGHPLPALTDNWTHGAASRHIIAPISHTRPSPRSRSYYSFPVPLRVGGWVGLSTQ